MKRAYHIPKNTGQAARKKCRKAIYAKEKFAEFKDEMKSEVKFGRAKPTCLKKNKEGLWEYAPSEMKAILKRQMFNMKRNSISIGNLTNSLLYCRKAY